MRKNTVQAQQWLEKCYPYTAPSKTTICRWYADFKHGRTDTNDVALSGRSNEAVAAENVKQVLKIVMNDRKVPEIAEMVNISTGSAYMNLHETLRMKNVFPKWVPHVITMEQKQQQVDDSQSFVTVYAINRISASI
ncbi:uncharacterized protein LOC118195963 [Stegodyphus dumicola]|uniref:uncharacterized protein LOC118195963 n=1 Tax=Stegodyphus dumicola TaxID=202533 RepID=UPI0015AAC974|nr:uncharacterized protein LOC118195963 [Stegodyphus dumicola]